MSASIQLFVGASIYSFLLSENCLLSYQKIYMLIIKDLLNQKNGVGTIEFKMKLGSTFFKRSILGEILLYVTAVVYRDREYSNVEELLCVIV